MKKCIECLVIFIITYLAFCFITNNFNPTLWEKGDKIMCLVVIAVTCTSRMYIDTTKEK